MTQIYQFRISFSINLLFYFILLAGIEIDCTPTSPHSFVAIKSEIGLGKMWPDICVPHLPLPQNCGNSRIFRVKYGTDKPIWNFL